PRRLDVALDVHVWIDDDRLARLRAADEVGRLRDRSFVDVPQNHACLRFHGICISSDARTQLFAAAATASPIPSATGTIAQQASISSAPSPPIAASTPAMKRT